MSLFTSSLESLALRHVARLDRTGVQSNARRAAFKRLEQLSLSRDTFVSAGNLEIVLTEVPGLERLQLNFYAKLSRAITGTIPTSSGLRILSLSFYDEIILSQALTTLLPGLPGLAALVTGGMGRPARSSLGRLLGCPKLRRIDLSKYPLVSRSRFNRTTRGKN